MLAARRGRTLAAAARTAGRGGDGVIPAHRLGREQLHRAHRPGRCRPRLRRGSDRRGPRRPRRLRRHREDRQQIGHGLRVGGHETTLAVTVGLTEQTVADFGDAAQWTFTAARATGSVAPGAGYGGEGLTMTYDFTQSTATRAAYAKPPANIEVQGRPEKFGMWINGRATANGRRCTSRTPAAPTWCCAATSSPRRLALGRVRRARGHELPGLGAPLLCGRDQAGRRLPRRGHRQRPRGLHRPGRGTADRRDESRPARDR